MHFAHTPIFSGGITLMKTIFHDFDEPLFSFHRTTNGLDPGYLHFHTYYEFSVVTSGKLNIIEEGFSLRCDEPCIIIHAPYSFHEIIAAPGTPYDHFVFHLSKECTASLPDTINIGRLFARSLTVIPIDNEMQTKLYPLLRSYDSCESHDDALKLLIAAPIMRIAQDNLHKSITESPDGFPERLGYIRSVTDYINSHYSDRLSADDIAKEYFISRQKLDQDFKAVMSVTLKQYVLDSRIANAIRLLSMGGKVADVTFQCGFSCESHFIHIFKERVGTSPYKFSKTCSFTVN